MRSLFILLFAAVVSLPVFARQTLSDELPRNIRFYYAGFAFPGEEENPRARFLFRNGKQTVSLQLNANAFSRTLAYEGPTPIALFNERKTEAGVEREDLGELRWPAEWKGVLFIVTRDPSNARMPFRFYPIEYWAPSLPDGHVRVMNLGPRQLATQIGGGQAGIEPGASSDLPLPADSDDVPLRLAVREGERWDMILSTAIDQPEQRKLLLLVFPRLDGSAQALVVKNLPEPPKEAVNVTMNPARVSVR